MLSREMSNHRTKERSAEASSSSSCPVLAGPSCGSRRSRSPRRLRCRLAGCRLGCWAGAGGQGGEGDPDIGRHQASGRWRWGWGSCLLAKCPPSWLPAPGLLLPALPSLVGVGVGVMPASFCRSTGPWLYGDSEARTQYVQNDFCTSKVERHPFDKGPFRWGLPQEAEGLFCAQGEGWFLAQGLQNHRRAGGLLSLPP